MTHDLTISLGEPVKLLIDGTAIGVTVAAILAWIPAATAILSFVWVVWRLYNEWLTTKKLKEK